MKLPKKQSLQMPQQQSHEKDESVLDEVQKEEEVQPAEWINVTLEWSVTRLG